MDAKPRGALIVPVICVIVAAAQFLLASFDTLTPWRGGGFGMFAVMDSPANRFLQLTAIDDAGVSYRIIMNGRSNLPGALSASTVARLLAYPTAGRLRLLAEAVLRAPLLRPDLAPPMMPAAVSQSRYGKVLQTAVQTMPVLEVSLGHGQDTARTRITQVDATVVRLRFDPVHGTGQTEVLERVSVSRSQMAASR